MGNAGNKRVVMFFLYNFADRERQRPHGAAVESPQEGNIQLALGKPPGKLECGLNGFGARIAKINVDKYNYLFNQKLNCIWRSPCQGKNGP